MNVRLTILGRNKINKYIQEKVYVGYLVMQMKIRSNGNVLSFVILARAPFHQIEELKVYQT